MRQLNNFFYKFMVGYHKKMRNLFNKDIDFIYDPIKSSYHDMRMQKWEYKVREY